VMIYDGPCAVVAHQKQNVLQQLELVPPVQCSLAGSREMVGSNVLLYVVVALYVCWAAKANYKVSTTHLLAIQTPLQTRCVHNLLDQAECLHLHHLTCDHFHPPSNHATKTPLSNPINNVTSPPTTSTQLPLNADRPPPLHPGHAARALQCRDPAAATAPRSGALRLRAEPSLPPLWRLVGHDKGTRDRKSQQCQFESCQRKQPCGRGRRKADARSGQSGGIGESF
jgi:hypothetical protein